jgi:hypothetical protein
MAGNTATEGQAERKELTDLLCNQIKTFVKHLSDLQYNEALLMFNSLDKFLQVLARILYRSEIYPSKVNKLVIFGLYRVVNTSIYN